MSDAKFDKNFDYDGDGDEGDKQDRKRFNQNMKKYGFGKPTEESLTKKELKKTSPFPIELMDSTTELIDIQRKAYDNKWHKHAKGQQQYVDAILNSATYKQYGANWVAYAKAKEEGGEDFAAVMRTATERIRVIAVAIGANLTPEQLESFAEKAEMFGWDEGTIRRVLTGNYEFTDGTGTTHSFNLDLMDYGKGWASEQMTTLKSLARRNGVGYNDDWYRNAVNKIGAGEGTADDYAAMIRQQAASAFPVWREQIEAGFDVQDLASPYVSIMQKRLGRGDVSLDDPLLKQAWNGVDDKGLPTVMGLWDFEKAIKRTDEWAESEDGHNEVMSLTRELGRTMGFTG